MCNRNTLICIETNLHTYIYIYIYMYKCDVYTVIDMFDCSQQIWEITFNDNVSTSNIIVFILHLITCFIFQQCYVCTFLLFFIRILPISHSFFYTHSPNFSCLSIWGIAGYYTWSFGGLYIWPDKIPILGDHCWAGLARRARNEQSRRWWWWWWWWWRSELK